MRALGILLASTIVAGCGSETAPNTVRFATGSFEIGTGDVFECFYTDTITSEELAVVGSTGVQGPGGHHIVAYYTDIIRPAEHHPCIDQEMVSWKQISGAANGEEVVGLPEGLAIRVPAGMQIVLQAHYINTSGSPMMVEDSIDLELGDKSQVQDYANFFVTNDDTFSVNPMAAGESVSTCTLEQDLNLVSLLGHMHEEGKRYKLEIIDETGATTETLYDEPWEHEYSSHPPVVSWSYEEPRVLPKGTKLKQSCEWNNTTPDPLTFPREMCLAFMYYYPDAGELHCAMEK